MTDREIIDLYFERDENAISETKVKYEKYLKTISLNVLYDEGEAEECVSDTYMRAWGVIPPERPTRLGAFLGRIVRNLSVNRYLFKRREKRGGGECDIVLDELLDVVPDKDTDSVIDDTIAIRDALNSFLSMLPTRTRVIFVRRYWYVMSVGEIARIMYLSESNVKAILMRTREKLKKYLDDKGVVI
jgi:RNA polymerase sigma-70 factor (ECF subfamily)